MIMKKIKILLLSFIVTCLSIIPINAENVYSDSYFFSTVNQGNLEILASDFSKRFNINVDIIVVSKLDPSIDLSTYANNHYLENYGESDGIVFAFNGYINYYVNTFGNATQYLDSSLDLNALFSNTSTYEKAFGIQQVLYQMRLKIENLTPTKSVVDLAGLLTAEQTIALQQKISNQITNHNIDIAIVTTYLNNKTLRHFTDDYYDYNDYGLNDSKDGIMLVMDMNAREWYIGTTGKAIDIFSDSTLDSIGDEILPNLKSGDYYSAFDSFSNYVDKFTSEYEASGAVYSGNSSSEDSSKLKDESYNSDNPKEELSLGEQVFGSLLIGFVIALVICYRRLRKLKTKRTVYNANNYIKENSFNLIKEKDIFLFSKVDKFRREDPEEKSEKKKSSSSKTSSKPQKSKSTTHRSSSGQHHGGRGGKF